MPEIEQVTLDTMIQGPDGPISLRDWIGIPDITFEEGEIPRIDIVDVSLARMYERALLATWFRGCQIQTQYDKPGDPPSRDCYIRMTATNPFCQPMIHMCFPGGIYDLEVYCQEVVDGIHDAWINPDDSTKWPYTYHDRLYNYNRNYPEAGGGINQIENMIRALAKVPYGRREQAITWYPWYDPLRDDPPCLQRVWCRLLPNKIGQLVLNMNLNMRSWDAFKASFMNFWAFADLERFIAEGIQEIIGEPVLIGPLTGTGDSYHIYGSYFRDPEMAMSFQGFLETLKKRSFEQRTMNTNHPEVQAMFREAREKIAKKLAEER